MTFWKQVFGYAFVFPWRRERFAPGPWTPRYDPQGRIYMLIAPSE